MCFCALRRVPVATGFRLMRRRKRDCVVVTPGLMPRKANEAAKTDRRDARKLAHFPRAGELTPVWVPDEEHEAPGIVHATCRAQNRLNGRYQRLMARGKHTNIVI